MFKELHEIAKRGPLQMMLVAEDDQLRLTVAQKKAAGAAPLTLSILATPAELDADLPAELEKAARALKPGKPVAAQVSEQVAQAAAGKASAKTEDPKPAAKPAKKATTHKRSVAARAAGERKRKEKAAKAKPAPKVKLPGATKPAKSAKPKGVTHHESRPDKAACIADYLAMKAKHGEDLTRELFIKKSKTGRRFERLWDMSWTKFVSAAVKAKPGTPAGAPPADNLDLFDAAAPARSTGDDVHDVSTPPPGPVAAAPSAPLPKSWPFPTTPKDEEFGEGKDDTSHGMDVYDSDTGEYLSSITTRPLPGEKIALINSGRPLTVARVDGRRVFVETHTGIQVPPIEEHAGGRIYNQLPEPSITESAPAQSPEDSAPPSTPSGTPAPARSVDAGSEEQTRIVKFASGRIIAGGYVHDDPDGLDLGSRIRPVQGGSLYRVVEFTDRDIVVELEAV